MNVLHPLTKTWKEYVLSYFWIAFGALLAAASIRLFLFPNNIIDGGVVGISLICARLFGGNYLSFFMIVLNIPFIYLAYKFIRRTFVLNMMIAVALFAGFLALLEAVPPFTNDLLEVIVIGGGILGAGTGLIIRNGGSTDGTEILAILINRKKGFTVGQIILIINVFIFGAYGWIFHDWHIALRSLMTYIVAFKMIDIIIAGLDELKSVMIMSTKPDALSKIIMHKLGLGLTILKGRGGFSGEDRDILLVIVERLDLSELKDIVLREDPLSFMAIENLNEVAYGKGLGSSHHQKIRKKAK
ncbi:MAG TPA: YitT family protein [Chlamydiales bacterium]|nr:YitT family protein [Chlamydiales bacterium]